MHRIALLVLLTLPVLAEVPSYIPIAAARQRVAGETVTVLGVLSVPSGRFRSSADEGFALQDQTGGIWVSTKKNLEIRRHQLVLVTGRLALNARKLQLDAAEVTPQSGNRLRVATGQVGAATLGHIITIEGVIRTITAEPYGTKVFVDDGSGVAQVFLNASAGLDATRLRVGHTLRATGSASQYETSYEVEPGSRGDLRLVPRR
jgi:hypothetical protein